MATTPAKKAPAKKPAPKAPVKAPVEAPAEAPVEEPKVEMPDLSQAPIDAPPAPPEPEPFKADPQPADDALHALIANQTSLVLCERSGEAAKAECLFTDPVEGLVTAKCRLLEKGVTMSGRIVTRLLLAEGSRLTPGAAAEIQATVTELNG